ncbi:MAG: hypothetical protein IGS48_24665 [Oscillatoriales cyanobacterium C42_A2020_001]|nr:hypothetical protein [Leptolyngbyaceae cyanobacterium C42_A2020_001]
MLKTLGIILTTAILMVLLLQGRSGAQSSLNLQADIYDLRSQVSQLRAEVGQLRSQRGSAPSTPIPSPPPRTRSPELSDAQIIDRLATLAIEAKDRLNSLERRVAGLEKRLR